MQVIHTYNSHLLTQLTSTAWDRFSTMSTNKQRNPQVGVRDAVFFCAASHRYRTMAKRARLLEPLCAGQGRNLRLSLLQAK